jgi:hypothetical protein
VTIASSVRLIRDTDEDAIIASLRPRGGRRAQGKVLRGSVRPVGRSVANELDGFFQKTGDD